MLDDGELLVRQLASPLMGGGDIVHLLEVGILLAEQVVLNGAMDNIHVYMNCIM